MIFQKRKDTRSREISLNNTNRTNRSDNLDNNKKESNNTSKNDHSQTNIKTIVSNLKSNLPIIQKVVIDFNKRMKNLSIDYRKEKYLLN